MDSRKRLGYQRARRHPQQWLWMDVLDWRREAFQRNKGRRRFPWHKLMAEVLASYRILIPAAESWLGCKITFPGLSAADFPNWPSLTRALMGWGAYDLYVLLMIRIWVQPMGPTGMPQPMRSVASSGIWEEKHKSKKMFTADSGIYWV